MTLFRQVTAKASPSPLTLYGGGGDAVSVVLVKQGGPTNRYLPSDTTGSEAGGEGEGVGQESPVRNRLPRDTRYLAALVRKAHR